MPDLTSWFAAKPSWLRFALLALLGGFAALGQAPVDLWPATIVGLALLMALHRRSETAQRAAIQTWAFGVGYFAFALRWIIEPFLVDIARHGWMAPFALILMAGGLSLFWGGAAYLARRFALASLLLFAMLLVAAEVVRSLILTGFPWALLGHIWVSTPVAQVAAFGGPHLLSLITVLAAWALVQMVAGHRGVGWVVVVLIGIAAFVLQPGAASPPPDDAPIVRMVQPNAPQHQKWDPAYRQIFVDRLLTYSAQGDVPDLIVWPETAIPSLLNYVLADMSTLSEAARGAPLVFGIQRRDTAGQFYNSFVVMGPGGVVDGLYDKRHLVPFGEYVPGGALLRRFGVAELVENALGGFTSGQSGGMVDLPGIGRAIPLICYEGIFAEEIGGAGRARLMVLITNDAWFGQAAGPHQHLAQARLRAIEQGLPMVRVANTGITAMIDARGRIVRSLPLGIDGAFDVALPAARPPTLYAQWGDIPILALLILLTFGCYAERRRDSN